MSGVQRALRPKFYGERLEASEKKTGEDASMAGGGSEGGRPEREESPWQLLEVLEEAFVRRAAEEGRIETTKENPREGFYRMLTAPDGPFGGPSD